MTLRVVGAGLGRTGTSSLREALEYLLGEPSYHMTALMSRPQHVKVWREFTDNGVEPDWHALFDGYGATLDWPACAYWDRIAEAFPDAFVLLSIRDDVDKWYDSFSRTIVPVLLDTDKYRHPAVDVSRIVTYRTFTESITDPVAAKRANEDHVRRVRENVPAERLVEWQPSDGWGPLCEALKMPVPAQPFPHVNTGDEFRELLGLDEEAAPVSSKPGGLASKVLRRLRKAR